MKRTLTKIEIMQFEEFGSMSSLKQPMLLASRKSDDVEIEILEASLCERLLNFVMETLHNLRHFGLMLLLAVLVVGVLYFSSSYTKDLVSNNIMTILEYGSIPIVSVLFTYFHIAAAIYLMFYPLEFIGICKNEDGIGLGWQGIVPRKAIKMASKAVDLMTEKLLKLEEVFGRLDPAKVSQVLIPHMLKLLEELFDEFGNTLAPKIWSKVPDLVKKEILKKAQNETPAAITLMLAEIQNRIEEVFDVKEMVTSALIQDKELLNEIFLRCGAKEFQFIKVSGAWIGFIFGCLQMGVWFYYRAWWILPLTGLLVGYLTNWLALKLIFNPVEPIDICGLFELQGLFLKRQAEVSSDYARLISRRVLTAKNMLAALLTGSCSEKFLSIIIRHIKLGVDTFSDAGMPLVLMTVGSSEYEKMKMKTVEKIKLHLPNMAGKLEVYTDKALDMENLLKTKMSGLSFPEFEQMLHPVFEEDEIILIIMGGFLGLVIGFVQTFSMGG